MRYWVVGGEYKDARFAELAPGTAEERHGPFATYDEAHKAWSGRAWATIDNALIRFRVVTEDDAGKLSAPEDRPSAVH
jgi:hypothetical protein